MAQNEVRTENEQNERKRISEILTDALNSVRGLWNTNQVLREARREASEGGTTYSKLDPVDQAKVDAVTEVLFSGKENERTTATFKDMAAIAIDLAGKREHVDSEDILAMVVANLKNTNKFKEAELGSLNTLSANSLALSLGSCKTVEDVIKVHADKIYGIKVSLEDGQFKVTDATKENIKIPSEILGNKYNGFALSGTGDFSTKVENINMDFDDISINDAFRLVRDASAHEERENFNLTFNTPINGFSSLNTDNLVSVLKELATETRDGNFTLDESKGVYHPVISGIIDSDNKVITLFNSNEGQGYSEAVEHVYRISEDFFQNSDCSNVTINVPLKYDQTDSSVVKGMEAAANKKLSDAKESMSPEEFEEFRNGFKVTVEGTLGHPDDLRKYQEGKYHLDGAVTFTVNENGELSTNWASKQECEERLNKELAIDDAITALYDVEDAQEALMEKETILRDFIKDALALGVSAEKLVEQLSPYSGILDVADRILSIKKNFDVEERRLAEGENNDITVNDNVAPVDEAFDESININSEPNNPDSSVNDTSLEEFAEITNKLNGEDILVESLDDETITGDSAIGNDEAPTTKASLEADAPIASDANDNVADATEAPAAATTGEDKTTENISDVNSVDEPTKTNANNGEIT